MTSRLRSRQSTNDKIQRLLRLQGLAQPEPSSRRDRAPVQRSSSSPSPSRQAPAQSPVKQPSQDHEHTGSSSPENSPDQSRYEQVERASESIDLPDNTLNNTQVFRPISLRPYEPPKLELSFAFSPAVAMENQSQRLQDKQTREQQKEAEVIRAREAEATQVAEAKAQQEAERERQFELARIQEEKDERERQRQIAEEKERVDAEYELKLRTELANTEAERNISSQTTTLDSQQHSPGLDQSLLQSQQDLSLLLPEDEPSESDVHTPDFNTLVTPRSTRDQRSPADTPNQQNGPIRKTEEQYLEELDAHLPRVFDRLQVLNLLLLILFYSYLWLLIFMLCFAGPHGGTGPTA